MKIIIMEDLDRLMKRVAKSTYGVVVHASTIGSMEALLDFLRESGVPVSRIHVGKVEKRHVYTAAYQSGHAEYRCILAFDVKVSSEAKKEAISKGIQIFQADIIYHLFDAFKAYTRQTGLNRDPVICPAILNIMQDYPMNNSKYVQMISIQCLNSI
jgi:translation initiation factor 5B